MHKKSFLFTAMLACIMGGTYFFFIKPFSHSSFSDYCAFCDPTVINNQKFYEDNLVLALYTHKPILPGHCLIVSKRHVERFEMLTDDEIMQISRVIKKVNQAAEKVFETSSYLLLQKNGSEVGQSVPHVHFHYIPRKKVDESTLKFLAKMYITNLQKPLSAAEMHSAVANMKVAMQPLGED